MITAIATAHSNLRQMRGDTDKQREKIGLQLQLRELLKQVCVSEKRKTKLKEEKKSKQSCRETVCTC